MFFSVCVYRIGGLQRKRDVARDQSVTRKSPRLCSRLRLVQNLGRDIAAAETGTEAEQAAQPRILAAQLRQKCRGQRDRIALRYHGIVAVAGGGEELGLPLEKEKRREYALPQPLRQRVAPLGREAQCGNREAHAGDEKQRVGARSVAIRSDRHSTRWSGRCGISRERRGSVPPHAPRRSWGPRPDESAGRSPVAAAGRVRESTRRRRS